MSCSCKKITKSIPTLLIGKGCECGTVRTPFECITQTSTFLAPAVGVQMSFQVGTIAGFYSVNTYVHVFNYAGVVWVGKVVSLIEAENIITLERVEFPGTVEASTSMGTTVCLLNVGAVLPTTEDGCQAFAARVKTAGSIPATEAIGTIILDGCWTTYVTQGLFIASVGWVRVQSVVSTTADATTLTYLVLSLLSTAEAGGAINVNSLVFPAEIPVTDTGEAIDVSGTNGAMVAKFTKGESGSFAWASNAMAMTFILPWDAIVDLRWKVGQATGNSGTFHVHWDLQLTGAASLLVGAGDNDADMSASMASSNWGNGFAQLVAGTYTATIQYLAQSGTTTGFTTLDNYSIQVIAHRLTGVVAVVSE